MGLGLGLVFGLGLGFGFGFGLEGDHGDAEAGEVGVLGEVLVEAHAVEELHAEDGVDEEQQQQQ